MTELLPSVGEVVAALVAGIAAVTAAALSAGYASASRRHRKALSDLADLRSKLLPAATEATPSDDLTKARGLIERMLEREASALERLTDRNVREKRWTGLLLALGVLGAVLVPVIRSLSESGGAVHSAASYVGALLAVLVAARVMAYPWDFASDAWHAYDGWRWARVWRIGVGLLLIPIAGSALSIAFILALTDTPLGELLFVTT